LDDGQAKGLPEVIIDLCCLLVEATGTVTLHLRRVGGYYISRRYNQERCRKDLGNASDRDKGCESNEFHICIE